jgi:tetratricopeptide (TPR) repeat protein
MPLPHHSDAAETQSLAPPQSADTTPPTNPPQAVPLAGQRVGPYEVRQQIGSGGMGTVYLAVRVDDYHQQVALKVLRSNLAGDELVQRFRTERQLLAGLSHPHVGRLLDGGTIGDGMPYLVMEYIDGQPLDRYCDARQLTTRDRARLLLPVCAAIHYAHQHTVIHRDLKPGNVLVTADGVPKVVDFGLAKRLGPGDDSQRTHTGVVLGTPCYMAPEQAAGKSAAVGPATDVYALGAILYELLTGRPPFRADTPLDTVLQVLHAEPVPPSRLHPNLPRDLETICLKCLHKDPHKRFASAEALAEDLRRFLAGEPIVARPVGRLERVWRWARRSPKVAGLLAALVVAVVGGFTAVTWLWLLAEERGRALARQTAEAEKQRDRAEKNFDRVFQIADESLDHVSKSKELKAPEMASFRRRLLDVQLRQFEEFAAELGDNPRAEERLARAHLRITYLRGADGPAPAAVEHAHKAIAITRRLVEARPGDAKLIGLLALAYEQLARVCPNEEEAHQAVLRAMELRGGLLRDHPAAAAVYRSQLAFSYHNVGRRVAERQPDEGLQWLERARTIREDEVRENRTGRDNLEQLGQICLEMAAIERRTNRTAAAVASCRRAIDVYRRLAEQHPDDAEWWVALADAYLELGLVGPPGQTPEQAVAVLQEGCAKLEQWLARPPSPGADRMACQHKLAALYYNLALTCMEDLWRRRQAEPYFRKVRDLSDRLLTVRPANTELLSWHATSCYNLALLNLLNPGQAGPFYRQARAGYEQVVRLQPNDHQSRSNLGQVLEMLARASQPEQAVELLEQAAAQQRQARRGEPADPEYTRRLAVHLSELSAALRGVKKPAEAAAVALERAQLFPGNARERYRTAVSLAQCMTLVGDGQPLSVEQKAERTHFGDLALAELRAAVQAGFRDVERMREDEDLEPLRGRADFQALVRGLEAKGSKSK